MAKLKIEVQVTLLSVVIATSVIATGYLAYKSISQIIKTVQQETNPDQQLFLMKDVATDLAALENNLRLYILTGDEQNLAPFLHIQKTATQKLENLQNAESPEYKNLIDSFQPLAIQKLKLWQDVLNLHQSSNDLEPVFSEIYSKLEVQEFDTVITETVEKGFFKGLFGKKNVISDTVLIKRNLEQAELKNQLENLESTIKQNDNQINILESKLIERNAEIETELYQLISLGEKIDTEKRIGKTQEANVLAQITYKRLALFSVAAIILLLAVIFLLFNYQKKSRAYQRALKKAKREAEKLARAKEQFASNVSHEMRTPLNAIYNLSEQLSQQDLDGTFKNQLSVLSRSASHLNSIINDTLDFSKIQAKKISFESIHFSPSSVFEEVKNIESIEAEKKGILLHFITKSPLPEALQGDPLRLKQILINLVGNAIKFTNKGHVTIKINVEKETTGKIMLHFRVEDSGIGISKANLEIIFDEFVQVENKDGKKYSGTGLGLAIVKKLVELQNGIITVESEPEKGTTFFVSIPYLPGDPKNIKTLELFRPQIPEYFKHGSILIADDEDFNRFILKNIFDKWGVKYQEAINGENAVSAALSFDFDIILMDIRMPKKDGFVATREILKNKPESKIIAVTADDKKAHIKSCFKAGMAGFLMKPFSEKDLFETVFPLLNVEHIKKRAQSASKISPSDLKNLTNNDPEFFKEMIYLFIKTSENGLATMQEAISKKDWETVSETAHKMAAPCKHLHANDLYRKLKEMETEFQNNVEAENVSEIFRTIKYESEEVISFLKNYLSTLKIEQT